MSPAAASLFSSLAEMSLKTDVNLLQQTSCGSCYNLTFIEEYYKSRCKEVCRLRISCGGGKFDLVSILNIFTLLSSM